MDYVSPFDERVREATPLAPRPAALAGRRVALLDITKNRGAQFLDRIEELLRGRGVGTFRISKATFSRPAAPEVIEEVALRGDLCGGRASGGRAEARRDDAARLGARRRRADPQVDGAGEDRNRRRRRRGRPLLRRLRSL